MLTCRECNTFQTLAHNSNNNTDDGDNTLGQGSVDDELALVYEKRLTEVNKHCTMRRKWYNSAFLLPADPDAW